MYLTQLFWATHLSEALLSRECVRIGRLVNTARGRLGAPYFSREKSEGCSLWPPPAHWLGLSGSPGTLGASEGPNLLTCTEVLN